MSLGPCFHVALLRAPLRALRSAGVTLPTDGLLAEVARGEGPERVPLALGYDAWRTLEEAVGRAGLELEIVIVRLRAELDLLDFDGLLLLTGFSGLFLGLKLELPVVHDLADGGIVVRRDFDEIHARLHRHFHRDRRFDSADIGAVLVDQLNLKVADFIVDARPVFSGGSRSSVRTANGVSPVL